MKMLKIAWIGLFLCLIWSPLFADTERKAAVTRVKGEVDYQVSGTEEWKDAKVGDLLREGDIIRTGKKSSALLDLTGIKGEKSSVEIKEQSQMRISELKTDEAKKSHNTLLDLAIGEVLIRAEKMRSEESKFEIKTPTSVVGVRGTEFTVEVESIK